MAWHRAMACGLAGQNTLGAEDAQNSSYRHVVVLLSSNVSRNISNWMQLTWMQQFWHDSHDLALRFFASTSICFQFCVVCINKNEMPSVTDCVQYCEELLKWVQRLLSCFL